MEDEKLTEVRRRKPLRITLFVVTGVVLLLAGSGAGLYLHGRPSIKIPEAVRRSAQYPIYIPAKLPGDYKIDQKSFSFQESVVIFQATDSAGGQIAFSEQRRPGKNFNFDDFYSKQITNAKTLNNTPFPSVSGKTADGTMVMLSIITNDSWVIATSRSPLGDDAMQILAQNMKPY